MIWYLYLLLSDLNQWKGREDRGKGCIIGENEDNLVEEISGYGKSEVGFVLKRSVLNKNIGEGLRESRALAERKEGGMWGKRE